MNYLGQNSSLEFPFNKANSTCPTALSLSSFVSIFSFIATCKKYYWCLILKENSVTVIPYNKSAAESAWLYMYTISVFKKPEFCEK